jgi:cytochrome c oxidase accessory protein FixG
MSRVYHRARSTVGTALLAILVLLPFIRINGEAAFRFDVPTLRLFFFGAVIWMEDFFIVLVAVLAFTFLILFITTVFGRIWCGWLCPQTVLVDLTPYLDRDRTKGAGSRSAGFLLAIIVSVIIAGSLIGYFVSPYDLPSFIRSGGAPAAIILGSWAVLSLLLFLDLVALRRTFCATVCPYAKLQGVLFDDRTLIVAFDQGRRAECMRCAACVRACPVGIDIRKVTQSACIHCAECVDACTERMAPTNRPSLIAYVFGEPAGRKGGIRVSLYLTGGLAIASALFFLYLTLARVPFEVSVLQAYPATRSAAADKSVTNLYTLSIRNTGNAGIVASLTVSSPVGSVISSPGMIRLEKGQESVKIPLTITVHEITNVVGTYIPLKLTIQAGQTGKSLTKSVSFLLP